MRYHFTPIRTAIIKKTRYNKWWHRCEEKGTLLHCYLECRLVQPLWKTVLRFLKKLKIELPYDPAIPHVGIYLKEMKTLTGKYICIPMFIAALFTIAKILKQLMCPSMHKWVKKNVIHTHIHNEILFSHKKKGILPFATTWMDLKSIKLSEINQTEKDKYHIISLKCRI